ncbi:host specificity factor TipJ family phage tail protein [Vibrio owensii]|uniref:host specificity factor TipJ family phage tail protein n=1 Tax=Vibrio owensii TaxID=696485 RepID=UPI00339A9468
MSGKSIDLVIITNPFEPSKDAVRETLPFIEGQTLKGYLGDLENEYIVSVNGAVIEEENYTSIYLVPGDTLVVSMIPFGGDGGGKGILRFVAVVALSYFTVGAGSIFSSMTANSAVNFAASSAAFIGGTMLINKILPPALPGNNGESSLKDSPTYGIDGAKNTSQEGISVPLVYGEYRMAGNIISMFTENLNDTQFLYMLVNAGEGEIAGIEDILLNDQPVANFDDVQVKVRYGTEDQTIIGWFGEIIRPFSVGSKITTDWSRYLTRELVDKVRLDIVFPTGLSGISESSGDRYERSVDFEVQYRPYNPANNPEDFWQPLPWETDSGGTSFGYFKVTGKTASPLRRSIKSALLHEDLFEIRYRRTSEESTSDYIQDSASISDMNEINVEKVSYKHTALVGIRIKLTDQLSSQPKITFINKGIKVRTWENGAWVTKSSSNPAWVAYDMITHTRYGGGISTDFLTTERFKDWAAWCDDQGLTFNAVIDSDSNLFDALEAVFRCGHAKVIGMGTKISVAIEKTDIPVMMFTNANIIKDSFSIDWLPLNDRANEIEVNYFDKKARYQQRSVKVYDEDSFARGEIQRPTSMTLIGVVDQEQAFYEGLLALNVNKYIEQTVTFDAHVDAIACTIGSVVYVQHDMPQWGYAGRVQTGSTKKELILDYDIVKAMEGAMPTHILLHDGAEKRAQSKILSVVGETITMGVDVSAFNIARAIISGNDFEVVRARQISGSEVEILLDTRGINISRGEPCELWETDRYEEQAIESINGRVITVIDEFSFQPEFMTQYMTGRVTRMKKRFRISSIDYDSDHIRTISAVEYNESIYDKDIPFAPDDSESDLGILRETELIDITETLVRIGKNLRPKVTLQFVNQSSRYQTSMAYVSTNEGEFELVGSNRTTVSFESEDEAQLKIRLVPVDSAGISMGIDNVTEHEYLVLGKTAPPADVKNFEITKEVGGVKLTWDANVELDVDGYEIREGASWDKGNIIAENLGSTILFVPINEPGEYIYQIRAVDTSGNKSVNPVPVEIGLVRPERVRNFTSVQHIDKILFEWDRPDDRTVNNFWLREGANWSNSVLIGSISGTSFEIPAATPGNRTFWIKAVDLVGLDSEIAVFSTTDVADLDDRNMVYESYHGRQPDGTYSAPGDKLNCEGANPITMVDDVRYAEYTAHLKLRDSDVDIGSGLMRARNAVSIEVAVIEKNDMDWEKATFPWNSESAKMPWAGSGDPEMVSFKPFIAIKSSGDDETFPGTKHLITLNRTLDDSITDLVPTPDSDRNVTYDDARYDEGVVVDPVVKVRWDVEDDNEWTLAFWALFPNSLEDLDSGGAAAFVQSATGSKILFLFSSKDQTFIVREAAQPDLVIENFYPAPGDFALVALSQRGNERTLRLKIGGLEGTQKDTVILNSDTIPDYIGLGMPTV